MEIINVTDEIIEINVTEAVVNVVTQNGAYPLPSNVFSVFGRVGNVVGQAGDYTTSIVAEGTNLYYTQARFNTAFGNKTTTDLTEGTNLYYTQARFNTAFGNKTTTDLAEGTNLYYTDARSRAAISENITGLEYSSASGIFSLASGYVIPTQASLDAKVPYTGATGNVTLGEYQLTAGQVTFDQTPTGTAGVGVLRWNNTDGTLDLGLKGGAVTLQIGQEQVKRVVNGAGVNLTEAAYPVVRVSGAQGQRLQVVLAQANNDQNSATTLGIVTENINNNQEGFITTSGEVRDINTTGSLQGETWADGDVLYLSPTTAGRITNIKPVAPNHMVIVGYVEYAHQNNGKIFVKVDNGYELDELHNVKITSPLNNQALVFDSTDSVWKNESIASAIGYTPANAATSISTTAPLTGGGDLSANRTFAITQSSASTDGYLSSTDWSTFNGKQPLIAAGTTAQYYRGDKTFQTLNTTAVAEGTNLYYTDARARAAITGTAPISVTSGVVSISQAGGAANGYLSSTDWNTFNNKQAALNGTGFVKISGTTISYDNNTYLTTISGIAAGGELSGTYANPSLVNSAVTGKILSGVNITGGSIADTDSILTAFGKLQNQVNGLIGGSIYKGTWNAATNTPTLTSSVGTKGFYYIVDVYGTTNLDGVAEWHVGDWAIFDGVKWQKVDTTDAVTSVNGQVGAVSLTTSNITEGSNLYFTNARGIGSTLTGYTSGSGVIAATDTILQAIQKLNGNVSGLVTGVSSVFGRTGAVVAASGDYNTSQVTENTNLYYTQGRFDTAFSAKSTTNLTEGTNLYYTSARFDTAFSGKTTTNLTEGTNLYYTEARVDANANVAANTAARHAAVTIGTANGLSLSTQALSLAAASTSTTGALTSTDWNTFNGKQAALNGTGFVKISGTTISYDNSTYLTTSAASSTYLPLAGGTLTGALGGTSATFSGTIASSGGNLTTNGGTIAAFNNGGIELYNTSNAAYARLVSVSGSFNVNVNNNSTTALSIASTGAATFSSSVKATTLALGSVDASTNGIFLNNPTANGANYGYIKTNAVTFNTTSLILGSTYGFNSPIDALTIFNGSATFANSVTLARPSSGATLLQLNGSSSYGDTSTINFCDGRSFIKSTILVTANGNTNLTFGTYDGVSVVERMRLIDSGFLKVSNTGVYNWGTNPFNTLESNAADWTLLMRNTNATSPNGIVMLYTATINNAGNWFYYAADSTIRFGVSSNGGIANYQANDVNLSDERTKKDIVPLESYWDKFKAIKIVKFKYKDQTHNDFNIGVIAQQVEKVAPEFVDSDGWDKTKFDNHYNEIINEQEPLKSIYTADLYHATIKVLQEAMTRIEEQQTQIEELKAKILSL